MVSARLWRREEAATWGGPFLPRTTFKADRPFRARLGPVA